MANDTEHAEIWSAISPGDLGLKMGFGKEGKVTFRKIIGWVTISSIQTAPVPEKSTRSNFHAVVLSDLNFPVLANFLPDALGVFPKAMSAKDAWEFSKRWRKDGGSQAPGGTLLN
jgi:hypothetical protein